MQPCERRARSLVPFYGVPRGGHPNRSLTQSKSPPAARGRAKETERERERHVMHHGGNGIANGDGEAHRNLSLW